MREKNPYSAEHPVHPSKFAGRNKQIETFKRLLENTIDGNSKNFVVLGQWGIGKTSLLWKMKDVAEKSGCIASIVELDGSFTHTVLLETITQSLSLNARAKKGLSSRAKEILDSFSISVKYGPVQITPKEVYRPNILRFKEDVIKLHKEVDAPLIIMLDNAEELVNLKGVLYSLRNTFQMLQSMEDVKSMLILAGSETLFSDIRSVSEPVARFFWDLRLEPFTYGETKEAIEKALHGSNVLFEKNVVQKIHDLSKGHPYFVQAFAYNLFEYRTKDKINMKELSKHYITTMNFLGFRLFDSLLSTLSPVEQSVVLAFAGCKKDVMTNKDVKKIVKKPGMNKYLKKLSETKPSILIKNSRGKYRLFHPLFKEYLKVHRATGKT